MKKKFLNNNAGNKKSANNTGNIAVDEVDNANVILYLTQAQKNPKKFMEDHVKLIEKGMLNSEMSIGRMAILALRDHPNGGKLMKLSLSNYVREIKLSEESKCLEKARTEFAKQFKKGVNNSLVLRLFCVQYIGKAIEEKNYKKLEILLKLFQVKKLDFSVDSETVSPELDLFRGCFRRTSLLEPMISLLSKAILEHISGRYSLTQLESLLAFAYKIDDKFQFPFLLSEIMKRGDYLQAVFYFKQIEKHYTQRNEPSFAMEKMVHLVSGAKEFEDEELKNVFPTLMRKAIKDANLEALKYFMTMSQEVNFRIHDQKDIWSDILHGLAENWQKNLSDCSKALVLLMKFDLSSIWDEPLQQCYSDKRIMLSREGIAAVLEVDPKKLEDLTSCARDTTIKKLEDHNNKNMILFFMSMLHLKESAPSIFSRATNITFTIPLPNEEGMNNSLKKG